MRGENSTIRVVVAGNTRMHAELLAQAIQRDTAIQVVGCTSNSSEVFQIAERSPIDVAVIGSQLDEQPDRGFEVLRELRATYPGIRGIVLLDSAKNESIVNAFRAGAKGIFSKNSPLTGLCKCIRCIHEGQIWATHEELEIAFETLNNSPVVRAVDAQGVSLLTNREQAVVECVAEGLATHEIAERLHLSKHTVKNYLTRVFDKLGVSNRVELLFLVLARTPARGEPMRNPSPPVLASVEPLAEGKGAPRDPMAAYVRCLINEKNILITKRQVAAAKKKLAESMTREQVEDAEGQVAAWEKKSTNRAS
jgi:DNA-binding NarL/FixJ family response regulator